MILVLDAAGLLVYESPSNACHLGYPRGALLGRAFVDLLHADERAEAETAFTELTASPGLVVERELRFLASSGEWCVLEVTARNLLDVPAVRGVVVNARDVTRRRRLDAELLRSQKLEAIGRLAGGRNQAVHTTDVDVNVDSTPGGGTVVGVRLPQTAAALPAEAPRVEPTPDERLSPGSETILLVEDEDAVRGLARRILQRLGYNVIEAQDGAAALRRMEEHAGSIDLVLTDIVMPGIGGIELARRVASERPDTRILFMSGYSSDAIDGYAPHGNGLIEKPFTPDMLAGRVRQALAL